MSLIDKIRKAREQGVEVDGRRFTIRRPTDEEALTMRAESVGLVDVVRRFTVGWEMAEIDLIPGGGPEKVPFDPMLFGEWVADRPEVWEPLGNAILDAYKAHADKREQAVKLTAWLEQTRLPLPPGPCPAPTALAIWNSCGLDWPALEIMTEIHGTTQPEILIAELLAMRSFVESQRG